MSEQELTAIIQMLQKLWQHPGLNVGASEKEVESFSEKQNHISWRAAIPEE